MTEDKTPRIEVFIIPVSLYNYRRVQFNLVYEKENHLVSRLKAYLVIYCYLKYQLNALHYNIIIPTIDEQETTTDNTMSRNAAFEVELPEGSLFSVASLTPSSFFV